MYTCTMYSIRVTNIKKVITYEEHDTQGRVICSENVISPENVISLNTLHNTKRLGPFLVFGYNSGEKQNRDILILSRR